jgi:hypothetical protein
MSADEEDFDALTDEELERALQQLEAEELEVSRLRGRLHDRLSSFPNDVTLQHERDLSAKRRALHVRIDALRAERSRRREELADDDG